MDMLMNGSEVGAADGGTIDVFNPASHEKIDAVPRAGKVDVDRAVSHARTGLEKNRAIPARDRHRYLTETGQVILGNLEELRALMIAENGKSHAWADFEIRKTAEIFMSLAERAKDPQGTTYPMDAMEGCTGQIAFLYRQPRGVVGGIIPFNFPAEMLAYKVGGALSAGNSIVVKLSEDCPLACLRIGRLMLQAGVPPETFHMLTGYGEEAGAALVEHPDVPVITFTGSSETGRRIMASSAPRLKHLSLELGGNDPVIVFEDADLTAVARNLVRGRMTVGNGQACVADKRFIVQEKVYDALVRECAEVARSLAVGDPADPTVDVGPLIHEDAARKVEKQVRDSVRLGAKIQCGGKRSDRTFIEPTVVSEVTPDMPLFREECFGPVAPFTRFQTEAQAIALANDSEYGLQGAVYTQNIHRAMRVADALDVGGVVVNASSCFRPGNVPYMPRKQSGLGTDNMYNCFEEMTTGKAVVLNNAIGLTTPRAEEV